VRQQFFSGELPASTLIVVIRFAQPGSADRSGGHGGDWLKAG
jgi:hypothetical protein